MPNLNCIDRSAESPSIIVYSDKKHFPDISRHLNRAATAVILTRTSIEGMASSQKRDELIQLLTMAFDDLNGIAIDLAKSNVGQGGGV